jgi:allantoate deiminase
VDELMAKAAAIAERRGLGMERRDHLHQPAIPMDERLTACMAHAMEAAGLPHKMMPSGAGHDAMVMAERVPCAMLFVRSPGGVSHHPAEDVLADDVEASLNVGREFLLRIANDVG